MPNIPNQKKKTVDDYLNEVSYSWLNSKEYVPSEFALTFMNFIKLVNGGKGEESKTPPMHLKMLDTVAERKRDHLVNLVFRGGAKSTLFGEYFFLYLAVFNELPGLKDLNLGMYIGDSMENGAKSLRKNIEYRYMSSPFLNEVLPKAKFTDTEIEFINAKGKAFNLRLYGATALSLDSRLFTENGYTTIKDCKVGDYIYGPDGKLSRIYAKSEIFHKPMYELVLKDGRKLKVSEDHINSLEERYRDYENSKGTFNGYRSVELTTKELLNKNLFRVITVKPNKYYPNGYIQKQPIYWVKNTEPVEYPEKDFPVDPYTVGLLLGDGGCSIRANGTFTVRLTGLEEDWDTYLVNIPYKIGKLYRDTRSSKVITRGICGIKDKVAEIGINTIYYKKAVPREYLFGSIEQRLALLQGLMDTDGTVYKTGRVAFTSTSEQLVNDVAYLVRSLGGAAFIHRGSEPKGNRLPYYTVRIQINMPIFKLPRKLNRLQHVYKDQVAVIAINRIADEPSQCIGIDNPSHQYLAEDFFRTHNTGLRGTKRYGKRPQICVIDDLISDESAKSKLVMTLIKDTIYNGVEHALDPRRRLIIFNGTPFNSEDPIIEAVESGAWEVNVYPICERFPCEEEEFKGAWEDRFNYKYIKGQYELLKTTGHINSFYQELMLQISADDTRLVRDEDIKWYSVKSLLKNRSNFNFYITTDFATSTKTSADWSVISVWAVNSNGDFFWVDGVCSKQNMDKNIDDLFTLVQKYRPIMEVGVEITGQQGAFISWLSREMMERNIWFTFASSDSRGRSPGIRPTTDKLTRFNVVLPWFKSGKMYFPEEMRDGTAMTEMLQELRLTTYEGIKGHDDFIDTISQLAYLKIIRPSEDSELNATISEDDNRVWMFGDKKPEPSGLDSYLV